MTEKNDHLTKTQLEEKMKEIESALDKIPYKESTVSEEVNASIEAFEEKTDKLKTRKSKEEKKLTTDAIEKIKHNIEEEIELLENKVVLYKETKTPKEAYFNVLQNDSLRAMTPYVRFASGWVFAVVEYLKKEHNLKYFKLDYLIEAGNSLPLLCLTTVDNKWELKNKGDNTISLNRWYFQGNKGNKVEVSTPLKKNSMNDAFINDRMSNIQKHLDEINEIEKKGSKLLKKFFFLPYMKRRIRSNVNYIVKRKSDHLHYDFLEMKRFYSNMPEDLTMEEEKEEQKRILDELVTIIDFLNEKLGLNIELILSS